MRDELDQRTHCLQMPITIGYASISSSLKLNELESQIALLGQQGCHRVFHDITYGINASRPSLEEILSLLQVGDTVLVTSYSQFGLPILRLVDLHIKVHQAGANIRSMDSQALDIGTILLLADIDKEVRSEIGKASIDKAKLRGTSIGRRRIINESLYKTALEHISSGESVRSAAIKVGVSKSTLYAEINRRKTKLEN